MVPCVSIMLQLLPTLSFSSEGWDWEIFPIANVPSLTVLRVISLGLLIVLMVSDPSLSQHCYIKVFIYHRIIES